MTIAKLDDLFEAALEAARQLFREAGKDSAEHAEILKFVQEQHWKLQKLIISETEEKEATAPLESIVADATRLMQKTGASPEKVMTTLATSRTYQKAAAAAAPFLVHQAVRQSVTRQLQRAVTTVAKAEQDATWHESQPEFAFANIEEFRGVPRSIRFVAAAGGYETIAWELSNREQRRSSLQLKEERKEKIQVEYDREFKVNQLLEPLVEKYGDRTPPILWKLKGRDEKKLPKASGDD
jgi:hypothetical protein